MSEDAVKYKTGKEITYKTPHDIFEEFLARTGIDPMFVARWKNTDKANMIEVNLSAGGTIIYISE